MKLGVMIEAQEGIGWPEWTRIVRDTEEMGYESLWRSDHFFTFSRNRSIDCIETFVSLTYAASNSSRIRFGPLVASMTFRPPAMVARMAAAIDQLSGGRFIMGIGAGWNQAEHDAFGIDLPPPGTRVRRLEEAAQVIRSLCDGDDVTFEGRYYRLQNAYMNPKPAQPKLPLLIGGGSEQLTLRVVAKYADEWNIPAPQLDVYRQKREALERHCEAIGRDPSTIQRSLMCAYVTAPTEQGLQEKMRALTERLPERWGPRAGTQLPWLIGTPSKIVEQIQAWEAEGVSRIMLQHREVPDPADMELMAKEVLPKV